MAKADLMAAQAAYDDAIGRARSAERAGRYGDAVRFAIEAWDHLDGMMRYERRYEGAEFKSVPCIDIVLRHAPLIFDAKSLDHMGELLRTQRSVERNTSDNLRERLDTANALMQSAYVLWNHLESNPDARQDDLRARLGGQQETWRNLAERWEKLGLVRRTAEGQTYRLRLVTNMDERVKAKCPECGAIAVGRKTDLLTKQTCPRCAREAAFVIRPDSIEATRS